MEKLEKIVIQRGSESKSYVSRKNYDELLEKYNELLKKNEEIEKSEQEVKELEVGSKVKYNGYKWLIIDLKNRTLMMKERMSKEDIKKYFTDSGMLDRDCDVKFSRLNNVWKDSYIRQVLNTKFLEIFNTEELEAADGDYIRLPKKEELEYLPGENRRVDSKYGYWTMTPCEDSSACAWYLYSDGYFSNGYCVQYGRGLRPVIQLTSEAFKKLEVVDE